MENVTKKMESTKTLCSEDAPRQKNDSQDTDTGDSFQKNIQFTLIEHKDYSFFFK